MIPASELAPYLDEPKQLPSGTPGKKTLICGLRFSVAAAAPSGRSPLLI